MPCAHPLLPRPPSFPCLSYPHTRLPNHLSRATGDTAPARQQRNQSHSENKMENELEMQKGNKQGLDSADEVAGREEKGSATGLLQKLTGDSKEKGRDVSK